MLSEMCGHLRRYALLPGVNLADRFRHISGKHSLKHVRACTRCQSTLDLGVSLKSSKHDDACFREVLQDRDHGVDATHIRKPEIHESDVGLLFTKNFDRLPSVRGLRRQKHVWLAIDDLRDALAQQRMIVNAKDTNSAGVAHCSIKF